MLLHDNQVRLTQREREVLHRLTGVDPRSVRTRAQLRAWVEQYLQEFPGDAPEIRRIKAVLKRHLPL